MVKKPVDLGQDHFMVVKNQNLSLLEKSSEFQWVMCKVTLVDWPLTWCDDTDPHMVLRAKRGAPR